MAKSMLVNLEANPVETGLWRDCCNLPSGVRILGVWWRPDGPHPMLDIIVCGDCGRKERVS